MIRTGRWTALLVAGLVVGALIPALRSQPVDLSASPSAANERPTLIIENFTAQVTRDGQPRQLIKAEWAQLDEQDQLLTMRRVESRFFNKGKLQGQANCGYAQTWLKDRPEQNAHRHDLHLMDSVTYKMTDGWIMQAPQMRYSSLTSEISSDQPYIKQLPMKHGFMVGRGDGFTMKLDMEAGTFSNWQEYGRPAVLEHSSTPVLKP